MALDMDLDLLGAQPGLFRLYTQLAFIFRAPSQDEIQQSTTISTLTTGLERLAQAFPYTAGQVVDTNLDANGPPNYRIRPLEPAPRLVVKNYGGDESTPTLAQLEEAQFPMSMLHEDAWAPCPTIAAAAFDPSKPSGSNDEPAPVMMVQVSFIKGGLVLCINMQHNVCDMMGQAAVMGWFSKACRGEEFTTEELELGNAERRKTVPTSTGSVKEEDIKSDLEDQLLPTKTNDGDNPHGAPAPPPSSPPPCSWAYYKFPSSSLTHIKSLASTSLPPSSTTTFISTDDALTAFIFTSLLRIRLPRLSDPSRIVSLARAVDARRYLNVPSNYPGILQNMTYTKYSLAELSELPLGHVAAALREKIDPQTSDVAKRTNSLLSFLAQDPRNLTKVSFTAKQKYDADIALSSWSKVPAYEWDFGLGMGSAVAVRRPGFVPVEGLMYIMPRDEDGAVVVAMCLREGDVEELRGDEEWRGCVECIG